MYSSLGFPADVSILFRHQCLRKHETTLSCQAALNLMLVRKNGEHNYRRQSHHNSSTVLCQWIIRSTTPHISCSVKHLSVLHCISVECRHSYCTAQRVFLSPAIQTTVSSSCEQRSLRWPHSRTFLHCIFNVSSTLHHLLLCFNTNEHHHWIFLWSFFDNTDYYQLG